MIEVEVYAAVNPTELEEKVRSAILNIFDQVEIIKEETPYEERFVGYGGIASLRILHSLLRKEQIIDTAHKQMYKGTSEDGTYTHFIINKQVAFVGKLNLPAQEEPLGSIHVIIKASSQSELERLFEWIVPPTEKGVPVFEIGMEDVER